MSKNILIWGSTALAGWLAAALHPKHAVTWLVNDRVREAVQQNGLTIAGSTIHDVNLIAAPEGTPDMIVLAMPAWGVAEAVMSLRNFGGNSPMVAMQMGVGSLQRIESVFGAEHTLAAIPTRRFQFAAQVYHTITVSDSGGVAVQADHPYTKETAALMQDAGLPVITGKQGSILWSSVFWGIQANAIATILDIAPAEVYKNADLFAYEHQQLAEALLIIRKLGIELIALPGVNVPLMARQLAWIPRRWLGFWLARHPHPPSLRDDLIQATGRSEAAYLNGAVALHAHDMNLHTPINHVLALTVTDIAEKRALWSEYKKNPELLFATLRLARA